MTVGKKIAVAMSGGVDSSVAAAILLQRGREVVGMTMRLTGDLCGVPAENAAAVAAKLGIEHRKVDLGEAFVREVVGPFADEYLAGRTPSPCIVCNARMKFGHLLSAAESLGAEAVATGHYCRREEDGAGRVLLLRAADAAKDQSYFLHRLTQSQLRRAMFPLGGMTKDEIRGIAAELNLPSASREESQEICFVPDGDYSRLVAGLRPGIDTSGEIVNSAGEVIGRHRGFHNFTVGQRRGIGIPADQPLYVIAVDAASRRVVVGREDELDRTELCAAEVNWVSIEPPSEPMRAEVMIRSRSKPAPATVEPTGHGEMNVLFDEPQRGVAPGQAAVFYRGDLLLGGGWIE